MAGSDSDLDQTFEIIERDTVPAPPPQPSESSQNRIAELRKWLQPTDFLSPGNEFMKHLHSYVPGTGRWIHKSAVFRTWARPEIDSGADSSCLHVRGVAGSGKSVFAASTIRQLQESGNIVLFFFFRQIVDKNHSAKYLIRDFATQLLPNCPALVASLTTISEDHAINGNEINMVWPVISKALTEGSVKNVFCVVDALDEMDDRDFEGIVQRLVELNATGSGRVRIMMTSRPLPKIEQRLNRPDIVKLKLDPALLSPDVARYVDARMATLDPPLSNEKSELVKQTICERANGLFLLARLVADNLADGLRDGRITEETLPDSLDRLPRTLNDVYEDMLREHARRSGVTAEQQAKVLMCVIHASRPLRLIELGSLLSNMLHFDLRRGKDLVRQSCGRLLELLEDESVSVIHHSFTEFLHEKSRRDNADAFPVLNDAASHGIMAVLILAYLDGCPRFEVDLNSDEETGYHTRLQCREDEKKKKEFLADLRTTHPLLSYAADNLTFHLKKAASGPLDHVQEALTRYISPSRPAFETWKLMNQSTPDQSSTVFHFATTVTNGHAMPLFVMEHFGKTKPKLIDTPNSTGRTPLSYAAEHGLDDAVRFLLANGADPKSGGCDGRTPLHWAALTGKSGSVQLLLDAGVDPLIKTHPVLEGYDDYEEEVIEYSEEEVERRRESALAYAFRGDDTQVVQAFMPFVPPTEVNQCFHRVDDLVNVEAVLKTGMVDIDCFRDGETKLFRAAKSGKSELVRLLLKHGADATKRSADTESSYFHNGEIQLKVDNDQGLTPLHGITHPYHRDSFWEDDAKPVEECIQALIAAGADVNAIMVGATSYKETNLTPLHLAVKKPNSIMGCSWDDKSNEMLTKFLLVAGADPNAKTSYGNTAMHLANPRKPCLFEMLIEHGADVNAKNHRGRTPLLEIVNCIGHDSRNELKPNVDVFSKLLDLGADVNATDEDGSNIFHQIMHSIRILSGPNFSPLIGKLVDAGVDLNARNQQNHPPLWNYNNCLISTYQFDVTKEEEDMLRVLVDAGMDLNASDDNGETILWRVCKKFGDHTRVMEKFVHMGADPKVLAKDGTSLLQVAAKERRKAEWFRYLISVGTNPMARDVGGDTLIHSVVGSHRESEPLEVIQILVEAGVAPLAKNTKGQTVLHMVKTLKMLEFVLKSPVFRGLDINQQDNDGSTPLHNAMDMSLPDQAAWILLRAGADPTLLMTGDLSVLHVASRIGHASTVDLLLSEYRKLGILEKHVNLLGEGRSPLHFACRSGRSESVWLLLRDSADPRMLDDKGLTPLHALAEFKASNTSWSTDLARMDDIVAMLQHAGVDLDAEAVIEADGRTKTVTALDLAVEKKGWELTRALVTRGAKAHNSYKQSPEFRLAIDKDKAAELARIATAAAPLYEDIEDWDKHLRWRGRWSAPQGNDPPDAQVKWYISGGQAIFDAPAKDPDELDQLDLLKYALHDGDYDSIKEYALLGGDIMRLDESGTDITDTLLHLLVDGGYTNLLEYFSDKVPVFEGQRWVQTNDQGCGTLLGIACMRQLPSLDILQFLVDKIGVDVNAVFNRQGCYHKLRGCTAVHILASGQHFWQIEALEYLLSRGADIEARNKQGLTPLLAALDNEHPKGFWREEAIRLLVRHGADVNAMASKYENTLTSGINSRMSRHSALEMSDQAEITKLLLENGVDIRSVPGLIARMVKKWMDPGSVKLLLEAGLSPNELPQPEIYDEVDDEDEDEDEDEGAVLYALHETCRPSTITNPPPDFETRKQAMLDLLLCHGANPLALYTDGASVIQCIVEEQGKIDDLLSRLSKTDINLKGHHGRTLLTSACVPTIPITTEAYRRNRTPPSIVPNSVLTLLEHGADALAVDDDGRTPLHWFCTLPGNYDEMQRQALAALIEHGPAAINVADKQGRKPFHLAVLAYSERSQDSLFAIQHLIAAGSNVAEPDPVTGNSTLHQLAPRLGGHAERAAAAHSFFRELSINLDINARNNLGQTPVMTFVGVGWEGTRDPTNNIGHPTYAIAHDVTHATALDVFVQLGADLTVVDARDQTLLHVTARRPLPDSSSDWDQIDDLEGTFKKLMQLGVDPRREDTDLRTAIDVAVARNLHGIINMFRKSGEDEDGDEGSNGDSDEHE